MSGQKTRSRKNFIEQRAERLAGEIRGEIRDEWSFGIEKIGRPKGAHEVDDLSLEEIAVVVIPIIEELSNLKVRVSIDASSAVEEIRSPIFAVLVAAILKERPRWAGKDIPMESIATSVVRARHKLNTPPETLIDWNR